MTWKDTTRILSIIISSLAVKLLFETKFIICTNKAQVIGGVIGFMLIFTFAINYVCDLVVKDEKEKSLPQTVKSAGREKLHTTCNSYTNIPERKEEVK